MATKKKISLSVALAVYNEQDNLAACLSSVRSLADEIIVVDGGSTDKTVAIARQFGAEVIETDNPPMFHTNKQKALDACSGEWILQLDADEVVPPGLQDEIRTITQGEKNKDGYYIPRHNYFLGAWLRKGGQYPDYVVRFFRRGKGSFPLRSVHEQIRVSGDTGYLSHALDHYSYKSLAQYWRKFYTYTHQTAMELKTQNRNVVTTAFPYLFVKPVMTFISLFVRHKGFVDGWRGFLFALFSAYHFPSAWWEYARSRR